MVSSGLGFCAATEVETPMSPIVPSNPVVNQRMSFSIFEPLYELLPAASRACELLDSFTWIVGP
jgi:hypothetical protein